MGVNELKFWKQTDYDIDKRFFILRHSLFKYFK